MTHSTLHWLICCLPQMSPRFISSRPSFSPRFPAPPPSIPTPMPSSRVHLGVVPVLRRAAKVYNLHRLLVWLHLASSSVLYFFCRNSKRGCVPCLSLCHRRSVLCKAKANASACNHLHGRQRFWQRTQVILKETVTQYREAVRVYNKSLLLLIALLSRPN